MMRAKFAALMSVMVASLAIMLACTPFESAAQGDEPGQLSPDVPVESSLTSRFGEEWVVAGCAGQVMTATMESTAFSPNLELYPPTGRTPLAATRNTSRRSVQLAETTLPENGEYTLVALGSSVRDRGAYSLTVVISGTTALPEDVKLLTPGESLTGTISSRDGEEWSFSGCARDVVTLTMQNTGSSQSNRFVPRLELYGPTGRMPVATSAASSAASRSAGITDFALPESGLYTVLALGQNIRDRGPYSLSLEVEVASEPAPSPTPTRPSGPICTVVSAGGLRLRGGPGTDYPIIGGLPVNTQLRPRGRDAAGAWIEVDRIGSTQRGWVSAGTQFVRCSVAINTLALAPIPPKPTPTPTVRLTAAPPTAAPPPTAIPTPAANSGLPQPEGAPVQGPGEPGDLEGDIYVGTRSLAGTRDGGPVLRGPFYLEMFVFDPDEGDGSGAGIEYVTFTISCPNGQSYSRTEVNERFCAFGGDGPCTTVNPAQSNFLPDSQCAIEDGTYFVSIEVVPDNRGRQGGFWNFSFSLDQTGR
jgi:hypothetical protein